MTGNNRKRGMTFAFRVTVTFIMIAAMTAVLMAGVALIVWNTGRGRLFAEGDLYVALLIAAFISMFLAIIIGTYFASDITAPVQRISKTADAIKNGDLSARTYLRGDDEICRLGEAFDAMADSIERDRDLERQLIGDVAHELRTPLMAIQATIEAIQDGVLPADETRLATISSETSRLGRLVEALLHLNRLENGTIVAKLTPTDLSDLVADLALNRQMLIESSDLQLDVHIEPGVRILGDHDLMEQAISNLISNAVRYTPEGGCVTISVQRRGIEALVTVADTGIGISEKDQDLVFSRFWRADSARTVASGGLGIGLALVKEVADQHHGRVLLESTLGEGSSFSIVVPLAEDDPNVQALLSKNDLRRKAKELRREQDRQRREQERKRKEDQRAARLSASQTGRLRWPGRHE